MLYSFRIILRTDIHFECNVVLLDDVTTLAGLHPQFFRGESLEDLTGHESWDSLLSTVKCGSTATTSARMAKVGCAVLVQVVLAKMLPNSNCVQRVLNHIIATPPFSVVSPDLFTSLLYRRCEYNGSTLLSPHFLFTTIALF